MKQKNLGGGGDKKFRFEKYFFGANFFWPAKFWSPKTLNPPKILGPKKFGAKSLGPDTFQASSRHPPDTFETPSRHPLSLKCPNMPVLEVQRVAGWLAGWLGGWLAGWIWDYIAKLQLGLSLAILNRYYKWMSIFPVLGRTKNVHGYSSFIVLWKLFEAFIGLLTIQQMLYY